LKWRRRYDEKGVAKGEGAVARSTIVLRSVRNRGRGRGQNDQEKKTRIVAFSPNPSKKKTPAEQRRVSKKNPVVGGTGGKRGKRHEPRQRCRKPETKCKRLEQITQRENGQTFGAAGLKKSASQNWSS